ncbi:hypothetical protein ACQ4PT_069080 [Festuca glaucescens]
MDMDVERSSNPAPPSSLVAELDTVKKRWWRLRSRARRALPAVCLVAATVLAFVVLSAAGDGWSTLPSSGFSVQDHEPPSSNLTTDQLLDGLLTAEFSSGSCRSRYEFARYHDNKKKNQPSHKPSPYLLAKLRRHEVLQKRCGPRHGPVQGGDPASSSPAMARSPRTRTTAATWSPFPTRPRQPDAGDGVGLPLRGAHGARPPRRPRRGRPLLRALPGTTWLLPPSGWFGGGFPLAHLEDYDSGSRESLGNMPQSQCPLRGAPTGTRRGRTAAAARRTCTCTWRAGTTSTTSSSTATSTSGSCAVRRGC